MPSLFDANLVALRTRYPALAARLDAIPDPATLHVIKARDGGVAYGLMQNGRLTPLTDIVAPLQRIQTQLDQLGPQLLDFTRPILIVGLYPGNELTYLFDLSEKDTTPHCQQPIWIGLDSSLCLLGCLRCWDLRRVIESPRVRWFWHEDVGRQIEFLREHPEFPHIFTLISAAPDRNLNQIMPPFAQLVAARDEETTRLQAENNAYYDALDDDTLATVISAAPQSDPSSSGPQSAIQNLKSKIARRPRLLMPTCSWSTFIQHSTRDTCKAFDDMGWESRPLKMEAMITPYYLVKTIHDFKPDVFLFIDHLRYEAESVYPKNMMFVTWVQDDMNNIQCMEAGRKFADYAAQGRRDLVIGYVDGLDTKYGYPKDRLVPLKIPADPRVFHPVTLTPADTKRYGCDLAFMSNVSMPSDQILDREIIPAVMPLGLSRSTAQAIHDRLWTLYRDGKTLVERDKLLEELNRFDEFKAVYASLASNDNRMPSDSQPDSVPHPPADNPTPSPKHQRSDRTPQLSQDALFRLFYWRLNDVIYRHVVLEWADELGLDLHLYGLGWENHPRFKKYAQGPLAHGPELNCAYQAARLNLHLNITQGMHQRIWEILTAGATPFLRASPVNPDVIEPPRDLMHRMALDILNPPPPVTTPDSASDSSILHPSSLSLSSSSLIPHPSSLIPHPSSLSLSSSSLIPQPSSFSNEAVADWIFNIAFAMAQEDAKDPEAADKRPPLEHRVSQLMEETILGRPDWVIENWDRLHFTDKASFHERLNDHGYKHV